MVESWLFVEPQVNKVLHCTGCGRNIYCGALLPARGEADEIGETECASRRFSKFRYKKLSTNQNQGIAWLSQGCSNTTLGTRLGVGNKISSKIEDGWEWNFLAGTDNTL